VKYSSSGAAQWAQSVVAGTGSTQFNSVAIDSVGNVYAAGTQGAGTLDYGNGATATGTSAQNVVLVKYDSSGMAQWARSVSAGTAFSQFSSVAVDSVDNVYVAGYQGGTGIFNYGNNIMVMGSSSFENAVLVKYSSSGMAQWAQSVWANVSANTAGSSEFYSVAVDSADNVYAAGQQSGAGTYNYGNGAMATATDYSVVLVKYNSSGPAQSARSVLVANTSYSSPYSTFYSVATDSADNVYAAGYQSGTGLIYGSGVTVTGNGVVLVKYSE
jgi:hypothetical protein